MTGFCTRDEASLRDAAAGAVEQARALGVDAASATVRAGGGISIKVRGGVAESAVRDAYQSLSLTVYRDGRTGGASTVALDDASIARVVAEAHAIAGLVQPDADAGLADPETLAWDSPAPEMFAHSGQSPESLMARALELEALTADAAAQASGSVRAGKWRSAPAIICRRWRRRRALPVDRGLDPYPMGDRAGGRPERAERARICTGERSPLRCAWSGIGTGPTGGGARRRTARGRSIAGRRAPVLFEARIAPTLIHALTQALFGQAQHSRASWLAGALGTEIAADHLDLVEDPFEPFGMASGGWDHEGVAGSRRAIIARGGAKAISSAAGPQGSSVCARPAMPTGRGT
ncbi:metallopeptidase TldD-related protein [Sphingomonas sp. I4]